MKSIKRRQTQAERRESTRAAILEATLEILIKDGYEGFTTTRVARAAGVSRGAQENYFRTKDALILAATRHALSEAAQHAETLAKGATRSPEPISKFLTDSKSFFFSRNYLALLEIIVVARHRPMLGRANASIVREFRQLLDSIWIEVMCSAGYERDGVERFVKMTHYLLRGMALTSLWRAETSEYRILLEEWQRIGSSYLRFSRGVRKREKRTAEVGGAARVSQR